MVLMSAMERFQAVMNGEDIDADTPSIDVEINVIQKEIEAEEQADEGNEIQNDIEDAADTAEQVEDAVDEAEMLVKILKSDGIDPIALKIISANSLYTNIWRIPMPSTESLDNYGVNRRQAEQLAAALEVSISGAMQGLKNIYEKTKDSLDRLWDWFARAWRDNQKTIETLRGKVVGMAVNEEKAEKKKVKGYDLAAMQDMNKVVNDMIKLTLPDENGKGASRFNTAYQSLEDRIMKFFSESAQTEINVSDIVKSITSEGDKFYSLVNDLKDRKTACEDKVKELKTYFTNLTKAAKANDELSKDEKKDIKRANSNTMKYLSKVTKVIIAMQKNYIKLAAAVRSCKQLGSGETEESSEA